MAPPRKPLAAARLSGAIAKNPQRYRNRHEPLVTDPLGPPPKWLKPDEAAAWRQIALLPWLNKSHRCIVGIAAHLHAKLVSGTLGVPGMQLLRVVLGSMGATPTDFHKVNWTPAVDDKDLDDW